MRAQRRITMAVAGLAATGALVPGASAAVQIPSTVAFTPVGGGVLSVGPGGHSPVGLIAVRLTCRAPDGLPCAIGVAIASGHRVVAKGSRVLSASARLTMRLSRFAQRTLRRHGLNLVTVAVARDHHGDRAVAGFSGKFHLFHLLRRR